MARRTRNTQDALPFEDVVSDPPRSSDASSPDAEGAARRPGRPRVWASEAERKRAYRERLASDFAEPDRLRRELRAERRTVAEKDSEIARLKRELARVEAAERAAVSRRHDLEAMIETLESKVDDWRSRAQALAKRREQERAEREEIDRRRASKSPTRGRLELPNLRTKGIPPDAPQR